MADALRFLRQPEVVETTGLSPTTIWRRERAGNFPKRRKIGPQLVAWRSDEIEAWIKSRPAAELAEAPEAS